MESANVYVKIEGKKYAIKQTQPDYSDSTVRLKLMGVSESPRPNEILIWRFNNKFGALRAYPATLKDNEFHEITYNKPVVSVRYPSPIVGLNIFHIWDFEVNEKYRKKNIGRTAQKILARIAYDKRNTFIAFPGWVLRPKKEVEGFLKPSLFRTNQIEGGNFKNIGKAADIMRHDSKKCDSIPHFYYFGTKKAKQRVRRNLL